MEQQIALFLISILLFIYSILAAISLGNSIFVAFPALLQQRENKLLVNPLLEICQVLLILFSLSLLIFFPSTYTSLPPLFLVPFGIGLLAFAIREGCLFLMYKKAQYTQHIRFGYLISSVIFPISLGLFYTPSVTGYGYTVPVAILFSILTSLGILLLAATFMRIYEHKAHGIEENKNLDTMIHEVFIFFGLFAIIVPAILLKFAPYMLLDLPKDIVCAITILISFAFFFFIHKTKQLLAIFLCSCLIVEAVFFSLLAMHVPYIQYPSITIYTDATTHPISPWVLFGFTLILAILIPSFVYQYYLFLFGRKDESHIY